MQKSLVEQASKSCTPETRAIIIKLSNDANRNVIEAKKSTQGRRLLDGKAVLPLQDLIRVLKQTASALVLVEGGDGIDQFIINIRVLRDGKHVNYVESDSDESDSEDSEHDEPATSSEDEDETNDFPTIFTPADVLKELKKAWRQQPDGIRDMLSQDEIYTC